ncbi:unnamed protein product [Darwinula stevensoni]|uniref:CTCK domain-containing protein n=1 Tax=Darwinula stevensoni TaxID=69355 RepID=A0A7R9FQS1_9CRUS|nr:unnamed protein product [Darwinula stevensoni]CAG0899964.1 unnamed protein product [Darwinula stevensoni]
MLCHAVHNIVLYPEKHAWCKLTPIRQIVTGSGCGNVELENNVCVGTCFSYTVPQTIPKSPADDLLHYCDSCQPSEYYWKSVYLECEEGNKKKEERKVQIITGCGCSGCSEPPLNAFDLDDLDPSHNDVALRTPAKGDRDRNRDEEGEDADGDERVEVEGGSEAEGGEDEGEGGGGDEVGNTTLGPDLLKDVVDRERPSMSERQRDDLRRLHLDAFRLGSEFASGLHRDPDPEDEREPPTDGGGNEIGESP